MLSTCIYYSPLLNGNYKLCTCHLSKNVMQHGQILVCTLCIVIVEHSYCGSSKYQENNQYINAPLASSVVFSITLDVLLLYQGYDLNVTINYYTHLHTCILASIPGRVFAFITVRRTTGPGTSCLRMRQSFVRF